MSDGSGSSKRRKGSSGEPLPSFSGTVAGRFNSCRSAVAGSGGVSWGGTDRLLGCNY